MTTQDTSPDADLAGQARITAERNRQSAITALIGSGMSQIEAEKFISRLKISLKYCLPDHKSGV